MRAELFNDRITAMKDSRNVLNPCLLKKNSIRAELEQSIDEFFAKGGQITELRGTEFKPKPEAKVVERIKPWRDRSKDKEFAYVNYKGNTALREWCNAKHGRVVAIAKMIGVPENYISQRINGCCIIQMDVFREEYEPAIKRVEKLEG